MASMPGVPVVRRPIRPGRVALFDVAAVAWIIACLLLGVRVHNEVLGLKGLTVTVERVGGQLESIGGTVGDLDIPLVGKKLDGVGEQARSAGAQAQAQAREGRASVESLATLLGVAVVILAIAPVLATYLPLRVRWWRDAAAERRLAERARQDPELQRLISQRAIITMPDHELAALAGRPWANRPPGDGQAH